jgi:hypothetical protein
MGEKYDHTSVSKELGDTRASLREFLQKKNKMKFENRNTKMITSIFFANNLIHENMFINLREQVRNFVA